MSMETWMLSCCIIAMEVWGNVYFFDTFMKKKREGRMETGRYFILFPLLWVWICLWGPWRSKFCWGFWSA